VDRRSFFKWAGFSLAAGVLSGCRKPVEKIVPALNQPPEMTPGVAQWYATTCHGCSAACGALAKVLDGRPLKFEGNPEHGLSQGGLCALGQAAVIGLYDPYRQKGPTFRGARCTWAQVDRGVGQSLQRARQRGEKVGVLTSTLTGPARRALLGDFLALFPTAEHLIYEPVSYEALAEAHSRAYGHRLIPGYRFDRAEVIVSFGADFLGTWLSPVEFTRQYAAGRNPAAKGPGMSRHFQFESHLSLTGSNADYRYPIAPSEQGIYLAALVARVTSELAPPQLPISSPPTLPAEAEERVERVAQALLQTPGKSLVVSDSNEVTVQLAVLALNALLGNVGHTVDLSRPSQQKQGRDADLARLVEEMQRGQVAVLLIHGCNPAYTWPEAEQFGKALQQVPCSVSLAPVPDETSRLTTWHCPAHHPLESWGDAEPQVGRFSLFQPTLHPLYDTRAFEDSLLQWLQQMGRGGETSFHGYLQRYWQERIFPQQEDFSDFTAFWDHLLQRGYWETKPPSPPLSPLSWPAIHTALQALRSSDAARRETDLEVEVFESVALRDGAEANNPWLQELPDPITKITWDNYAAISPSLAREKHLAEGHRIELTVAGRTVTLPVHIQPGQHRRTLSVALGYGRTYAGPEGSGVGVNAYPLIVWNDGRRQRSSPGASLRRAAEDPSLFARTQLHDSQEGRPLAREATLAEFLQGWTAKPPPETGKRTSLWAEPPPSLYKWGMVIDLTRCTGCSACVVGCDLENNVPPVGREEVRRQREMHWLRIDRYFSGEEEAPQVVHQPMPCQHCDNASCETVCPALATVHDDQGLNVQVYNRCVGTRYCANNCPYKVRRFNFFHHVGTDPTRNLALNPDVTVRSRGVMEKCSFCLQRIQAARIAARREGRTIRDGEVHTACEQSCPAQAIVFGNLADPHSRVAQLAASPHSYRVLEELNRQPAVYYLVKVRNVEEDPATGGKA